jgi:hypothetical protein
MIYKFVIIFCFTLLFCNGLNGEESIKRYKIYSGSYGYDVVYRIENNKIYSGSYGYDIIYRVVEY